MKLYCAACNEVKSHRPKGVPVIKSVCNTCDLINLPVALIKSNGERHFGREASFIKWGESNRFKDIGKTPEIGLSCIIDPQRGAAFTWLTTPITEIIEKVSDQGSTTYRFRTENSEYNLYIYDDYINQ